MSCLQRLLQWQLHEPVFWQRMESVLDLYEREKATVIKEQDEQMEGADSAKIHRGRSVVVLQLESLGRLKDKVQVLEREVYGLLEKHRPYLEKIQRTWQLKAKTVTVSWRSGERTYTK